MRERERERERERKERDVGAVKVTDLPNGLVVVANVSEFPDVRSGENLFVELLGLLQQGDLSQVRLIA